MVSPSPNWSNSNLRRRSFRGQDLEGANFQGADLRGCDFSHARLKGANFSQALTGAAPESITWGLLLMVSSGAIAFHLLTIVIFSLIGLPPEDPNYPLRLPFISLLALGGGLVGIAPHIKWTRLWTFIAASIEGLLYGFLIGGILSHYNALVATFSAGLGVGLFGLGERLASRDGFGVILNMMGVALANGMFLIAGIHALQAFFGQQWLTALGWSLLALLYFGVTLQAIGHLSQVFKNLSWTSFEDADLTDVRWK